MNTFDRNLKVMRAFVILLTAAAAMAGSAAPASAHLLNKTSTCTPGQKWNTSSPVKVRILGDSVFDYLNNRRPGTSTLVDLARLTADVNAAIDLYNSIPGSSLVLEPGTGITGDSDLSDPAKENYGTQTIVIGFTNSVAASSATAEAWEQGAPEDNCTRTRAHIRFRKDYNWIFGPPDSNAVDGRAFYTAEQSAVGSSSPRTFLGILTHEMGHAMGLAHPDNNYAVMAQSFRTWFRGADHVLRTRLLPDDTAGMLALYGKAGVTKPLDISVTATWYKAAEQQFKDCTTQIAKVREAAQAVSDATGVPVGGQFPADRIFKGEYADLFQALANAQDQLLKTRFRSVVHDIDAKVGRLVVVAHSQGTVIAVDALRNWTDGSKVDPSKVDLLTMGSPLRSLYARFFPVGFGKLIGEVRPHVNSWLNLYRADDYVGRTLRLKPTYRDRQIDGQGHEHYWTDTSVLEELERLIRR